MRLEYYFDFTCPFAYLGSLEARAVAARTGAGQDRLGLVERAAAGARPPRS